MFHQNLLLSRSMWIWGRLYNSSPALCRMSNCTDGELVSHWFRPAAIQGLLSWKNWSTSIWSRRLEFCFIHAIHVLMYSFDVWLFGWMWTNHGQYVSKHTTSESRKFLSWMVDIYIYIFHFVVLHCAVCGKQPRACASVDQQLPEGHYGGGGLSSHVSHVSLVGGYPLVI